MSLNGSETDAGKHQVDHPPMVIKLNETKLRTRYSTQAEAKADILDYIEPFYNRKRVHSTPSFASPVNLLQR